MDVCIRDLASLQNRSTDRCENYHGYVFFLSRWFFCYPLCSSFPPGGATAYQLLHHSNNRQVANMVAKNDANWTLSPTFCYVPIESAL
ncbi:uncharacterized protein TNCV_70661 [Trichonephila clavipes]|nr:uncharacterized protein TNCV_70661 [Trichonephila clavipes]